MSLCIKCNQPTRFIQSLNMYQTTCDECHEKEEMKRWYIIDSFKNKLKRIGINVEMTFNAPWIYLDKVNGVKVKEKFYANHGFTAFFYPVKLSSKIKFSDMKYVFDKIRQIKDGKEQFPIGQNGYEY